MLAAPTSMSVSLSKHAERLSVSAGFEVVMAGQICYWPIVAVRCVEPTVRLANQPSKQPNSHAGQSPTQ